MIIILWKIYNFKSNDKYVNKVLQINSKNGDEIRGCLVGGCMRIAKKKLTSRGGAVGEAAQVM